MGYEVVFDIETQNSFAEVDNDFKKLRVSVVSLYRSDTGLYYSFTESELSQLWPILEKSDRVIGYNSTHFDLPVLNNYYPGDLLTFSHLDIMAVVKESIGIRLKLNDLALATLDDVEKSADGLQAIRWWKEGKIDGKLGTHPPSEKRREHLRKIMEYQFGSESLKRSILIEKIINILWDKLKPELINQKEELCIKQLSYQEMEIFIVWLNIL